MTVTEKKKFKTIESDYNAEEMSRIEEENDLQDHDYQYEHLHQHQLQIGNIVSQRIITDYSENNEEVLFASNSSGEHPNLFRHQEGLLLQQQTLEQD